MSTVVKFIVLYLIPVVSFAAVIGSYLLVYGESSEHPLINLALLLVASGFVASSYVGVKLISQFVDETIIYSGIIFTVLGWLLGAVPVVIYLMLFKGFLNP
ncbi:hypothetical protein K0504_17785 [Neiella marina]|uniref:Uncharacterized protein n=1 Tax=Neiella holothuriorum TaxID=2870530 RepID=A0ABS7EL02_9GAMM|nr:hypothetical protein [Neiella holothuriorum]MBW8192890.1 hypothetical protein [Neiella holothuriorum]